MSEQDLAPVLEIESSSFSRPWTRSHFLDEIGSCYGYPTVALEPDGAVAGYLCLKQVLDEAEILDVAVKGTTKFHATAGAFKGRKAIRLETAPLPPDKPLSVK